MAVPTGGINRYQISNQIQDKTLFTQIQEEGDTFDPLLLFLLGYNFCKFEDNYEGKSFLELAKIMQRSIGGKLLNKPELQKTYKTLYEQEYLSDVLNLQWFKRYKEDFEEEHEAISLMKKNPRVKQKKREENKDCPFSPAGLSKSPKSVEPEVIPEEGDFQQIPSFLMNGDISGQENNEGMDSFQNYQQIIAQQEKIEQEKKLREEEESKKLIEQLLAQEEEQEQRAKEAAERQERESILAAQEIQKQFDEEAKLRRHEEEEKNKPEWKIWYDIIEFGDINVLGWGHIYHPYCMKMHLQTKTDSKSFPLSCPEPEWGMELTDLEIQTFCDGELYDKIQKFQFELFLEQNNEMFNHCPTPDCKFVFEWDGNKEDQQFKCGFCHKTYCIMCRVDWHEGLNCKEYRELNGYPPEDRAFYKFIKGSPFKQCPKCKFWVEKSSGCDHMTCRCKYEFWYKCGGKYRECECCK